MGTDALQRLEDQLAIRGLVARYDYAIDEERPEDWVATFVPEGTFESTALGAHSGADALLEFARGTSTHSKASCDERLRGHCRRRRRHRALLPDRRQCQDDAPQHPDTAVYDDVLRRTPDGWRFVHRKVTPDSAFQH